MPYLQQGQRDEIDQVLQPLMLKLNQAIDNRKRGAILNYIIHVLVKQGFGLDHSPNYSRIEQAIGSLECAKLELYRRIAAPYEDEKIESNGDI